MTLVTGTLLWCCCTLAQSDLQGPVHPSRLLVQWRQGIPMTQISSLHEQCGARVLHHLPQIRWQVIEVPADQRDSLRDSYAAHPAIARANLDRSRPLAYVPNDPYWPYLWHMTHIKADQVWDTERGSSSVKVAIMDTGLETTHPDLAANVWTNPGETPANGIDDDGNGYIDDVNGYDFAYGDSDPNDVYGHGTACAGLVAAVQDNSIGVCGVAPQCRLVGVKASIDSGYFYDSANVPALVYCADMGFDVISMSFFSDFVTPAERDAIDYCWQHGVVPVAAAGNAASVLPYYPGAYENVVSVAAIDGSSLKTWFTNWGSWVDVAAPGLSLATTTIFGGYTTGFAGTSGACPHVSGLAALLFSADSGATNRDVRRALEDTAIPTVLAPFGEYTNYGQIDSKAALDRLQGVTSGHKPGRLLFANPVAGGWSPNRSAAGGLRHVPLLIYGVGLERTRPVRVLRDGLPRTLFSQSRNWVSIDPIGHSSRSRRLGNESLVELEVDHQVVGAFVYETDVGFSYAPCDVCTQGDATSTGGFLELYRTDGTSLVVTRRSDGWIFAQIAIRKVFPPQVRSLELLFTRAYDASIGATESIDFYDWTSYSYPYGSFVNLSTRTISTTSTETVQVTFTDHPERLVDDEGTMYIQLTTVGTASGARLLADSFRVRFQ